MTHKVARLANAYATLFTFRHSLFDMQAKAQQDGRYTTLQLFDLCTVRLGRILSRIQHYQATLEANVYR